MKYLQDVYFTNLNATCNQGGFFSITPDGDWSMADDYFELLSNGFYLVEGAEKTLKYLKQKGYTICITTNGVSRTQDRRIDGCGLKKYFDYVIVSEDAKHQKPEKEYFEYVIRISKPEEATVATITTQAV